MPQQNDFAATACAQDVIEFTYQMIRPSRLAASPDRFGLAAIIHQLAMQDRYADALYVIAILKTDLVEAGDRACDPAWPKPGDAVPPDWHVHEAVIGWFRGQP